QQQFRENYVIDLAAWRQSARAIVPVMEQYKETEPYALWLKSRLDYLDVAEELRKARPPASSRPGETLPPRANPPAQTEREVWIRKTAERPWPERAKPYMNLLRPVFVEEKVPPELIWVAEV